MLEIGCHLSRRHGWGDTQTPAHRNLEKLAGRGRLSPLTPRATEFHPAEAYRRHFANPRRERAFLSAVGFTTAFAACRIVTHSIRAGIGPFHNMSAGGRHLHHSTFGILGQIGLGYVWTYQWALGVDPKHRLGSRTAAILYGVSSALTLDEFALWFDLQDDYWDKAGRKSIDAVALFGGISTIGVAGRGMFREMGRAAAAALREARKV